MNRRLLQGNEAVVEGALAAGVRFFAGYPITPATEIAEAMSRRLPALGGAFVQMEDEIASLGAVIGASAAGAKAMTASSGPGISLMQENIGFAAIAEIPCVIVNVQRMGPSTGMPTHTAHMDVMQARWGSHGDYPAIAFAPGSVAECFDLTIKAVNTAERFRTPVFLLSDAVIGHMREAVSLPSEVAAVDRPRPTCSRADYAPYRPGPDGIPPLADLGTGYRYHIDSNVHDELGFLATDDHVTAERLLKRLQDKVLRHASEITLYEEQWLDDAEVAIFAYGVVGRAAAEAVRRAHARGLKVALLRAITLWSFPERVIAELAGRVRAIVVAEMNLGQMVHPIREAAAGQAPVHLLARADGKLIEPDQVLSFVEAVLEKERCKW
jgi:2-oxoglutarate/2-oxoacid ferredoxin oxidoreductase subunit alpha